MDPTLAAQEADVFICGARQKMLDDVKKEVPSHQTGQEVKDHWEKVRKRLDESARADGFEVYYPELELCTDNGAMIAYAGAFRAAAASAKNQGFEIRPRWNLADLVSPATLPAGQG
jgi:short-subunit dehydrogenase involved in D-alanine esterification of teichoic acids